MKKILGFALLVTFSLNSWAYTKGKTYKFTILHTNDHHGNFWPNAEGELGLAARATAIQNIRDEVSSQGGHVLLLDAGDVNTGVPESDMQNAEPDFKGMSLLNYDVMVIGNHEFDKPNDILAQQIKWANFPVITSNIYKKGTSERAFPSHVVKELEDLKVTIFGLTTEDTPMQSSREHTKNFDFIPAVQEAKKIVPKLRKNTDVLIALTHMGHYENETHGLNAPGDVTLARNVPGIDIVVGGHTRKPLFEPSIENDTILLHAGEWGKYLGRLDLEFIDGKLSISNYRLVPINLKDSKEFISPDPNVEAFLPPYKLKGEETLKVELGRTDGTFEQDRIRYEELPMGNLITKAYKEKASTDVAIANSGGFRKAIPAGIITYGTILNVLPFKTEIVVAELSGKELFEYIEQISFDRVGTGSFPQMSGLEVELSASAKKVLKVRVNGKKLNKNQKYTIALPEFIAMGGDNYPEVAHRKTGFVDADILKDYVLKKKNLKIQDYAVQNYVIFR